MGIFACVLAFSSLPLEWWTLSRTDNTSILGQSTTTVTTINVYLYKLDYLAESISDSYSYAAMRTTVDTVFWFGWATMVLMVMGGLLAVASSFKAHQKKLWLSSGMCMLSALSIFSLGTLPSKLTRGLLPIPNLGFLTALLATGIMFFGYLKMQQEQVSQTSPDEQQAQHDCQSATR